MTVCSYFITYDQIKLIVLSKRTSLSNQDIILDQDVSADEGQNNWLYIKFTSILHLVIIQFVRSASQNSVKRGLLNII